MSPSDIRRSELHAHAFRVAKAACAKHRAVFPGELRQVLSYWLSCELASERAAENLISYAAAFGITDPSLSPPSTPRSSP
jgi:hypothetical protein